MSYLEQPDMNSCVPVAAINAMKWLGQEVGIEHLPRFKDLCKFDPAFGADARNLYGVFCSVQVPGCIRHLCQVDDPRADDIDGHLSAGGAIVVNYWAKERKNSKRKECDPNGTGWMGHAMLITERLGDYYLAHNPGFPFLTTNTALVPRRRLLRLLRNKMTSLHGPGTTPSKAWLITKYCLT